MDPYLEDPAFSRSLDYGSPIKAETVAETRHWIEERAKPRRP